MISITKHTDYSIVILAHFAKNPATLVNAKDLAISLKLPYPTVSKLLKILAKSGLVKSIKGAHGGYLLHKPTEDISIASIVEAVEGPIAMTECTMGVLGQCRTEDWCSVKPHWALINQVIKKSLEKLPLSALLSPVLASNLHDESFEDLWAALFRRVKESAQTKSE